MALERKKRAVGKKIQAILQMCTLKFTLKSEGKTQSSLRKTIFNLILFAPRKKQD